MESTKTIEEIEFVWIDSTDTINNPELTSKKVCNFPEYRRKYLIAKGEGPQTRLYMEEVQKSGVIRYRDVGLYRTEEEAKLSAREELEEVLLIVNCSKSWTHKAVIEEIGINSFNKDGIDIWIRNEHGLNECWVPKEKIQEMREFLKRIEEYIKFYDSLHTPLT
jgi:hypothetical protein